MGKEPLLDNTVRQQSITQRTLKTSALQHPMEDNKNRLCATQTGAIRWLGILAEFVVAFLLTAAATLPAKTKSRNLNPVSSIRQNMTSLLDALRRLFPACVTEAQGQDGQLRPAVDFDALRQELSDCLIDGPSERYQLTWPGKRAAMALANEPCAKILRPCPEESVNFETTNNLFIEGFKKCKNVKPSGECEYNLDSEFRLNDGNCENDSGDRLHSSFSRMADKKIKTTEN